MRPQLNIPLDGNPELLEKLRKFCKVRGYRISDYCIRILSEAIDKEVSEFANNETIEPSTDRIKKLEVSVEELRSRLDVIESQRTESISNSLEVQLVESLPSVTSPNAETSQLTERLRELLDTQKYPPNNGSRIKKRLSEIIAEFS